MLVVGFSMKNTGKLIKYGLFIVLFIWLLWTFYWAAKLCVSLPDMFATPDPFGPLYFSSTLAVPFLFVGLVVRTVAAGLAIYAANGYFSKGWTLGVRRMVGAIIVLEAIYLISIIPTAWIGPDVSDIVLIPEATIPSLFEAIFVPIPLLILAARLKWPGKTGTAFRWACISGIMYIWALFVRFVGQWIGTFIQTDLYTWFFGGFPYHGFSYVLDYPVNMFSFLLTAVGLPIIAIYLLLVSMPAIRNLTGMLSIRKIGLVLTLVGVYFMLSLFLMYAMPESVVGGKSIWNQFFAGHNVDLWMLALPIVGIPLMFGANDGDKQTG